MLARGGRGGRGNSYPIASVREAVVDICERPSRIRLSTVWLRSLSCSTALLSGLPERAMNLHLIVEQVALGLGLARPHEKDGDAPVGVGDDQRAPLMRDYEGRRRRMDAFD